MLLSEKGVDRQEAHAKIREVSLSAREVLNNDPRATVCLKSTLADPFFDEVRAEVSNLAGDPMNFTGACKRQVSDFLKIEYGPATIKHLTEENLKGTLQLDV